MLNKLFKLEENRTTIRKETLAGIVTFLTMSYILIVNPDVLSITGMNREALYTTTALATAIATLLMAFIANLPIAQAPGMGLNSFFAYTVVISMGYSWQFALTAVLLESILFLLLTIFNIREIIINSIPKTLKEAIPAGIGLFITFVGLKNAEIIQSNENTIISLGDLSSHSVWMALTGLLITAVLFARNIKGAILIGIICSTILGYFLGDISLPDKNIVSLPPSIEPIFFKFEWNHVLSWDMLIVVFIFLFVNIFDTLGSLIGIISKIGDEGIEQKNKHIKKALLSDTIGNCIGAFLGSSPVTTYIESSAGVSVGGRTGLTAVVVSFMFVLSLFFAPLFLIVPSAAVAPALIIVGLFMISSISKIDFKDITEALPAFLTIIMMPFAYSIAEGIIFGIGSFVVIKLLTGKYKQVSLTLIILCILFIIKTIIKR